MNTLQQLAIDAQKECDRLTFALPNGFHFIASYQKSETNSTSYPTRNCVAIKMQTWSGSVPTLGYLTDMDDLHKLILSSPSTIRYRGKLTKLAYG